MRLSLLLLATGALLSRSEASAQEYEWPLEYRETAYALTVDLREIAEACSTPSEACGISAVMRVLRFIERPGLANPPGREEVNAARRAIVKSRADSSASTFGVAASSSTGPLSLPGFAFNVTDFLLERAKIETVRSLFTDLGRAFERNGDLKVLFPKTHVVLHTAQDLNYKALVPALRSALSRDLVSFPAAIQDSTLEIYEGEPVPDAILVLGYLAERLLEDRRGGDLFPIVEGFAELSGSLGSRQSRLALFLVGRMARETQVEKWLEDVEGSGGRGAPDLWSLVQDRVWGPVFLTLAFSPVAQDVDSDLQTGGALAEEWGEEVADLASALSSLSDAAFIGSGPAIAGPPELDPIGLLLSAFRGVAVAGLAFADGESGEDLRFSIFTALDVWSAVRDEDWGALVVAGVEALNRATANGDPPESLVRALALASGIAGAETGEELQLALEAAADPVGSFRSRRGLRAGGEPNLRVSVVSYLGFSGGGEWLTGVEGAWTGFTGAFLPLGLEISWGRDSVFPSSVGLFVSFLDFGTLASYRLKETVARPPDAADKEEVDAVPAVQWQHLFSPSAHVVFGITQDHPLSVGMGIQYAPELRSLEETARKVNAVRVSVFMGLDLTLLRF